VALLVLLPGSGPLWAQPVPTPTTLPPAGALPESVQLALRRARIPESAVAMLVQEVGTGTPRVTWNEQTPLNPASVFKLFTTFAALDQLGPAWTWKTPVLASAAPRDGVQDGSVFIRGSGDPKLVVERVWLLLRRLQQAGVRDIRGDIVLDSGAFDLPAAVPGEFDGDASRPYNVRPDALLLNFKTVSLSFVPQPGRGLARVTAEPALDGVLVDAAVPLSDQACNDWRANLKARLDDPDRLRWAGQFPGSCGERVWPLAYADPASYNARLIGSLWRELGGSLGGKVRAGVTPAGLKPLFEFNSPALAEVVRDINKFSNNVMAEQLFLSLPLAARDGAGPVRPEEAREHLRRWLQSRLGDEAASSTVIDNGSGLSRDSRVSAQTLARLLQRIWSSPLMPELMSSLPVGGVDGTLRQASAMAGRTHLKTGSLRDVSAVAGYVLADSGRRYVLVALINHPQAQAGRTAIDALVQWTQSEPQPGSSLANP
jgi:D-alanyl-D-alanine carboxypeptidase/D-alanyl-D-alanine-endopeptidase (penicillin-binding protein 4)